VAHAVVLGIHLAVGVDQRHDFLEAAGLLRRRNLLVAPDREGVHLLARDAELPGQVLGGLAHHQVHHRIGEALDDADHRGQQHRRAQLGEHAELGAQRARLRHQREPHHHLVGVQQRRARQGIDAAGQHQLRAAAVDVGDGRIQRLHARGAVAHHGPARHLVAAAQAQRDDAADVHFVDAGPGAADDDFVEVSGAKGWRASSARPEIVARSDAEKGPGTLRDLRKGERAPSTM
jgi:hypothetical protein